MDIKPIRTEQDYELALKFVGAFFDNPPEEGSEDFDKFDVMATLIEAYEKVHHPVANPSAIDALKFQIDQKRLTVRRIGEIIGAEPNRVYEIFNGTRKFTLDMIRNLHNALGISYEILMTESVHPSPRRNRKPVVNKADLQSVKRATPARSRSAGAELKIPAHIRTSREQAQYAGLHATASKKTAGTRSPAMAKKAATPVRSKRTAKT